VAVRQSIAGKGATVKSSLEIAQDHRMQPIVEIARAAGLLEDEIELYGRYKAKIELSAIERLSDRPDAKIVNVTAITPTPAGEGKTTSSVALAQGLGHIGRKPILCLREPSLGPIFGVKGGAAGGGYAQVVPMEDLNLHFTGDLHAITSANNLLSAFIDAHLYHGNVLGIDPSTVSWRRCADMNDRNLRNIVSGLGGKTNGIPRETGFDITAASEVTAILALSRDLGDLRQRLGNITIGQTYEGRSVKAEEIRCAGAMTTLLKDAIKPNLIQTLEGQPCLMHGAPFANIAHGNNSIVADRLGLKLGDYLITESGFASDMGMEKFMDIVCRSAGLQPSAVVVVATVRALFMHGGGGIEKPASASEAYRLIEIGCENLAKHVENVREFGIEPVVAINRRPEDTDEEVALVKRLAGEAGALAAVHNGFGDGGPGAAELAEAVVEACDRPTNFKLLYADDAPFKQKIEAIATRIYGADGVDFAPLAIQRLKEFQAQGLGHFTVCMAKTHLSLSADPNVKGRPRNFRIPVRDVRAYTGAGFVVPLCGDVLQMPGLGKTPAGFNIDIDADGKITGMF
jgi:formate--tetrahydrofolate ligase